MTDTSGYEKMRAGEIYPVPDFHLLGLQAEAHARLAAFNATPSGALEKRLELLGEMLGSVGRAIVVSPLTFEYGRHIHIGDNVFVNFDCIFLDGADIRIGDGCAIGPRVQFLTVGHPVDPAERIRIDHETGQRIGGSSINRPITVGRDCWIGAGAIILGGVTIGDGSTIGAGSIVTRNIPEGVLAAGNPCRVIRSASQKAPPQPATAG